MSELTAKLASTGELRGSIGAGSVIVNDYTLTVTDIEGGHRLTVTRGSETQVMDVMDGTSLTDEALAEIAQEAAARVDFPVDSVNSQTSAVVLGAADVGALPDDTVIPDVPDWAMQPNKPTYTAQEVGALPNTTVIPDVPVQDVQVGGVSVVSGGVANVPSVREVLTAPVSDAAPAWSEEERDAAQQRIGLNDEYEHIETITIEEDMALVRTAHPDGTPYKFAAVAIRYIRSPDISIQKAIYLCAILMNDTQSKIINLYAPIDVIQTTENRYQFAEVRKYKGYWQRRRTNWSPYNSVETPQEIANHLFDNKDYNYTVREIRSDGTLPAGLVIEIYGVRA